MKGCAKLVFPEIVIFRCENMSMTYTKMHNKCPSFPSHTSSRGSHPQIFLIWAWKLLFPNLWALWTCLQHRFCCFLCACILHTGFLKKRHPFSKIKNTTDLQSHDRENKIICDMSLLIFKQWSGVFYGKPCTYYKTRISRFIFCNPA